MKQKGLDFGAPIEPRQARPRALTVSQLTDRILGVLEVEQTWSKDGGSPDGGVTTYFDLSMLDIEMGSIGEGTIQVANVGANGKTRP